MYPLWLPPLVLEEKKGKREERMNFSIIFYLRHQLQLLHTHIHSFIPIIISTLHLLVRLISMPFLTVWTPFQFRRPASFSWALLLPSLIPSSRDNSSSALLVFLRGLTLLDPGNFGWQWWWVTHSPYSSVSPLLNANSALLATQIQVIFSFKISTPFHSHFFKQKLKVMTHLLRTEESF